MFPQFYQNHLEKQLTPTQYQTMKALVYMLQSHRLCKDNINRFFTHIL